jgi:hypothetical protein
MSEAMSYGYAKTDNKVVGDPMTRPSFTFIALQACFLTLQIGDKDN